VDGERPVAGHLDDNGANRHEYEGGTARALAPVVPGTHAPLHVFERSPGAATRPLPRGYRPRRPQTTAFYRVIADHLETMLQDARDRSPHGFGLPRHVEDSFRRLLDCGIMERGFARVVCPSCQYEILVPFAARRAFEEAAVASAFS
jgi:hypothetical protein